MIGRKITWTIYGNNSSQTRTGVVIDKIIHTPRMITSASSGMGYSAPDTRTAYLVQCEDGVFTVSVDSITNVE